MNAVATKTVTTKSVSSYDRYFYVNEEGKILNLAPNRRAPQLGLEVTGVLTDVYCGNAVFLGEADAPEELTDLVALHLTTRWSSRKPAVRHRNDRIWHTPKSCAISAGLSPALGSGRYAPIPGFECADGVRDRPGRGGRGVRWWRAVLKVSAPDAAIGATSGDLQPVPGTTVRNDGSGAKALRARSCGCPRCEIRVVAATGRPLVVGGEGFDSGAGELMERFRGADVEMVQVQVNLKAGQDATGASH